jgi:hypothetical protein
MNTLLNKASPGRSLGFNERVSPHYPCHPRAQCCGWYGSVLVLSIESGRRAAEWGAPKPADEARKYLGTELSSRG